MDSSTSTGRLVLISANPYSGARSNRKCVTALAAALAARGLEASVVWERAARAEAMSRPDLRAALRCIVAAGGDGTVAEVINDRPNVPVAVMPLGTENLFAREFGFGDDAEKLAAAVETLECRTIDLGQAGERRFSLMLSAGFDACVVHATARRRAGTGGKLRRGGYLNYVWPAIESLCAYEYGRIELEADGEVFAGTHAFIFNLPQYALRMQLAPEAQGDDGWLDWLILERPGRWNLMDYLNAARTAAHVSRPDVRWGKARRLRLTSEKPVPLQLDGDAAGWTPVDIHVLPGALRVLKI